MRPYFLLALLGATHALAAPPLCTLPATAAIPVADRPAQAELPAATPAAAPARALPPVAAPAPSLPDTLAALPFVRHEAQSGASITDLGSAHGLQSIVARGGDQFMVFQITPDGQAAVSGALTELTASQLTAAAGGNVTPFAPLHGLDGLFVRSGAQFQVFYIAPDGDRVIPGVMWDSAGKDLTREQVANVPGAVPKVVVGDVDPAKAPATPSSVSAQSALPLLQKAAFGTVGQASAPRLWMLVDPQCIYSVRAYQMLHPYVVSGRVQLSIVPLSVLDYEDKGQSTKSALALLGKPADQIVSAWQAGSVNDPPTPTAAERLQVNMAIAQQIGLQGTPTLIWRKPDGSEGRIDGVPTDVETLLAEIGH